MSDIKAYLIMNGPNGPKKVTLKQDISIGRGSENNLRINDETASRKHARVMCLPNQWILEDMGSSGGTKLNGEKIKRAYLVHGDRFKIGKTIFELNIDAKSLAKEPDIVKIMLQSIRSKATDIVLKNAQVPKIMVNRKYITCPQFDRLFVDKDLEEALKVVGGSDALNQLEKEGHLTLLVDGFLGERFRLHVYRQQGHLSMLMRRIKINVPTLSSLGLPKDYKKIIQLKQGLILLGGAPNSGKTTSLAAMLGELNRTRDGRILTIEDPVEFRFIEDRCMVDQIEVGVDVADFEEARNHLFVKS